MKRNCYNMMANESGFLSEKKSWRAVTDVFQNVEIHNIDAVAKNMEPVNFAIDPKIPKVQSLCTWRAKATEITSCLIHRLIQ